MPSSLGTVKCILSLVHSMDTPDCFHSSTRHCRQTRHDSSQCLSQSPSHSRISDTNPRPQPACNRRGTRQITRGRAQQAWQFNGGEADIGMAGNDWRQRSNSGWTRDGPTEADRGYRVMPQNKTPTNEVSNTLAGGGRRRDGIWKGRGGGAVGGDEESGPRVAPRAEPRACPRL